MAEIKCVCASRREITDEMADKFLAVFEHDWEAQQAYFPAETIASKLRRARAALEAALGAPAAATLADVHVCHHPNQRWGTRCSSIGYSRLTNREELCFFEAGHDGEHGCPTYSYWRNESEQSHA